MTTIDIATTEGDVVLIMQETRLRVSSVILSSASPVFKAMFGPNFKEGQGDRSAQHPKDVPLPDDEPLVMTRFCRLLHCQRGLPETHEEDSQDMRAKGLLDLVVLADKYGCMERVQMACGYILFDLTASSKPQDMPMTALMYLIAVAFMLEDHRHFTLFTRQLVMDHVDNYSAVATHPALAVLPNLFLRKCIVSQSSCL